MEIHDKLDIVKQQIHIIYIPGFGGRYDTFRLFALRQWLYSRVTTELVPMNWHQGTFEQKLARIDRAIDRAAGKQIVLVGESAGGSMVVHQYARRGDDIYKAMTLCGKNSHPETVGQTYYDRSPAFQASMARLDYSTKMLSKSQKTKFVSIHPIYDPVVPVRETLLANCRQVRLWAFGHLTVILLALTVFSFAIVRAAKR